MQIYVKNIIYILITLLFTASLVCAENNEVVLSERIIGDKSASNTIIEYASLSCVHCANFHINEFPEIKKRFIDTGKIKFIFRDFPLDLPAMIGSMVAQCQDDKKYFTVLSSLFRTQKKWAGSENVQLSIAKALKEHGIKMDDIEACLEENETNLARWKAILDIRLKGQEMGVESTPTFFINNKKIDGSLNISKLEKLIY